MSYRTVTIDPNRRSGKGINVGISLRLTLKCDVKGCESVYTGPSRSGSLYENMVMIEEEIGWSVNIFPATVVCNKHKGAPLCECMNHRCLNVATIDKLCGACAIVATVHEQP